jgi:hypothetical protein
MLKALTKALAAWTGRRPSEGQAPPAPTPAAREASPAAKVIAAPEVQRGGKPEAPRPSNGSPPAPAVLREHKANPAPERPALPAEVLEERIRVRAYFLAQAAGFPAGRSEEFWRQAEREIHSGNGHG